MKNNKRPFFIAVGILAALNVFAQNVTTRSADFEVDFSDPKNYVTSKIPVINWITPTAETSYSQENKYKIKFAIASASPIKNITLSIKEAINVASRGTQTFQPDPSQNKNIEVEKNLTLLDGENVIEIIAENEEGVKTISFKTVRVGTTNIADATNTRSYRLRPGVCNRPVRQLARSCEPCVRCTYGCRRAPQDLRF